MNLAELQQPAHETGDELLFGVLESIEPRASEPTADNTDFGDWFSCSETETCGDEDCSGCSNIEVSLLSGCTILRG